VNQPAANVVRFENPSAQHIEQHRADADGIVNVSKRPVRSLRMCRRVWRYISPGVFGKWRRFNGHCE
jgi:hypothetical protein